MEANQNSRNFADYKACVDILQQEIMLLERISILPVMVRNAVVAREWTDFEGYMENLGVIGREFQILDAEREQVFTVFARKSGSNNTGVGFYSLIARFPEEERRELGNLYRKLKIDALKIGFANDSLTAYIGEARTTLQEFLEAAFPDRKGRIYSKQGTQVPSDMRSMVLNQSL
jgi:hypothetical protein